MLFNNSFISPPCFISSYDELTATWSELHRRKIQTWDEVFLVFLSCFHPIQFIRDEITSKRGFYCWERLINCETDVKLINKVGSRRALLSISMNFLTFCFNRLLRNQRRCKASITSNFVSLHSLTSQRLWKKLCFLIYNHLSLDVHSTVVCGVEKIDNLKKESFTLA